MIAMALSCDPELILCDEPTTALDVTIQDQILRLLTQLCHESGTSLVFVTHDLPVVAQVCHKVAVMYAGRIVERGTVAEVFRSPRHPYTLGLLRSAPDVDQPDHSLVPIPGAPPSLITPPSDCRFHPRCPHVMPRCSVELPPRLEVRDVPGHWASCWLYDITPAPAAATEEGGDA
jgi:oligopeptide/dipeptide ABC transporter ATP-binding protein